jgi:hypothetical protein
VRSTAKAELVAEKPRIDCHYIPSTIASLVLFVLLRVEMAVLNLLCDPKRTTDIQLNVPCRLFGESHCTAMNFGRYSYVKMPRFVFYMLQNIVCSLRL